MNTAPQGGQRSVAQGAGQAGGGQTPSGELLSLRMAVAYVLRERGLRVLERPKEFLGFMMDLMDPDSMLARVLMYNCDEELLGFFSQAARVGTPQAIEEAANRATLHLNEARMIQEDIARRTACEISFAIANHLGVTCPVHVRMAAVGTVGASGGDATKVQDSSWYDAQRARGAAQNIHEQNISDESGAAAENGPNGVDPGASRDQARDAKLQASGTAALSTDRTTRQKQIEEAGIGMRWFEWLKFLCWVLAGGCLVGAFTNVSVLLHPVSSGDDLFVLYLAKFFANSMLCVWYITSWNRLRLFKKNGPNTFLGTAGANVVYLLLDCPWMALMAGKYARLGWSSIILEQTLVLATVGALIWLCTYRYFKKRKKFFSL